MHVLSSRSRFAGVGLERRATTPYAPIEAGGMSAARKYTRAGTRRGTGTPVGAGGTAVGADFGAGTPVDAGGTTIGADFGAGGALVAAGGTGAGAGRVRRIYGARSLRVGGTADGRGATVVGDFGATFFRCAKHLSLRAWQAASTPRLTHSPRA
jgi:hypothetical protein